VGIVKSVVSILTIDATNLFREDREQRMFEKLGQSSTLTGRNRNLKRGKFDDDWMACRFLME
jgi:hypothetical protein